MGYSSLFKDSKEKVYHFAIATKILDLMEKLRIDDMRKSKCRWIWELMQNAKDVRHNDKGVSIEINLNENLLEAALELRHKGKPFSVDNITFLIEQLSTKARDTNYNTKTSTTGKFGTGFFTTHLLSEVVTIKGCVKGEGLPYKKFELKLDRSGNSIEEVMEALGPSSVVLSAIEDAPAFANCKEQEFNTIFHYELNDAGIDVAKTGLRDLENSLPFTMVFVTDIKSVTITHNDTHYVLLEETIDCGNDISIYCIKQSSLFDEQCFHIAVLSGEKATIAIPVSIGA